MTMFELAKRIAHNMDIPPELVIEVEDRYMLFWDGPTLEVEFDGDSVTITVRRKSMHSDGVLCVETGVMRLPFDRDKPVTTTNERARRGERVFFERRVVDLDPIDRKIREDVIRFGESLTAP
jgi:hypothetical protein